MAQGSAALRLGDPEGDSMKKAWELAGGSAGHEGEVPQLA